MCAKRNQDSVPQYLSKRDDGRSSNWRVRLEPPKSIAHLPGVASFRKSTGTADLKKAKTIAARLIAEKRAEWDALLEKASSSNATPTRLLTQELITYICAHRLYQWMFIDDLTRYGPHGLDEESLASLQKMWQATDQSMRSVLAKGRASPEWKETMETLDFWCNQIEIKVSQQDPLYPQLLREFARVDIEGVKSMYARNAGEAIPTPDKPLPPLGSALSHMTEIYRSHLGKARKGKQLTTSVGVWERFVQHVGDLPIDAVQPSDVFGFLEARLQAKDAPWSMKYAHGPVLRTIRAVFSLAISMGLRQTANPADALHTLPLISAREEQERMKPRRPYTDKELTKVFSSEWYNPQSSLWKGKMATDLGARYWVPLICLVHGNRVREVLQLVASDFDVLDGLHVLRIQKSIPGGQAAMEAAGVTRNLKTEATERTIPLHPLLIELGILDFIQSRREDEGGNALLFPSSIPQPGGKTPILGRSYEQTYLRYVRDGLGLGSGLGNHGFRHQLEDRIRQAQRPGKQWPAGLGQQYVGRKRTRAQDLSHLATEGSESDYGEGYTPAVILMYVKDLDFSGVTLPPPYSTWIAQAPKN